MEVFWTIITAVTIYVMGQTIQEFILKPLANYKTRIADISHKLKYHSNIMANSSFTEKYITVVRGDMRDLSSGLESAYLSIPFRDYFSRLHVIPDRKDIQKAAEHLIQLSNAGGEKGWETKNWEAIEIIKKSLNIVL